MIAEFLDLESGVFGDRAFRELLTRETGRAIRYQDYFSLCLLKPDDAGEGDDAPEPLLRAVSRKIAQFLRASDIVGLIPGGTAVLLLNASDAEAVRVVERLRAQIEVVGFQGQPGAPPRRITLSAGLVSFPRHGSSDTVLLSRAQGLLGEAARAGGNRVVWPR